MTENETPVTTSDQGTVATTSDQGTVATTSDQETPLFVQGSNNPLIIEFDESIADIPKMIISLWSSMGGMPLKVWHKSDILIDDNIVICPLTEDETAAFPGYQVEILVKGLDANGYTIFWRRFNVDILHRQDRVFKLTQDGG